MPIERVDEAVLNAIIDQILTDTVVEVTVERVLTNLAPTVMSRTMGELRAALKDVEREISNVTGAIAKGGRARIVARQAPRV